MRLFATLSGLSLALTSVALGQFYPRANGPKVGDPLPSNIRPAQLDNVGIEEKLGSSIDLDLKFIGEDGYPVALREFFKQGKPVVLDLVYYNCPMLCTLVLNGQVEAMRELAWTPGKDYEVVTISIDPREAFDVARKKKAQYLSSYDRPAPGWHFLTDTNGNAKKLAESVGYHYKYDEKIEQYAHPAAVMVLTPEGKMARYLYGIKYRARDMRLAIAEASEGRATMALEKILLYCYHYDPQANSYVLFAQNVMRGGGMLTVLLVGAMLWRLFRAERARALGHKALAQEGMV